MKRLRFLSLLTAVALTATLITGCQQSKQSGKDSAQTGSTSSKKVNEFGWAVPERTLKIGIFNAYGNDAPTEEEKAGRQNMKKYLIDNFNVDIEMQTVDGDGTEALNLALASGNYPDVVYNATYDMALKFQNQGKAVELTPYMDSIGKDIKAACKDTYPLLLDDQNKLWFIPTEMGALMELPDYTASIRYDEWTAAGSPKIETPDDYYNALKTVLKAKPKTSKDEKRYALSLYNQNYPLELTSYWGLKRGWKIDDSNNFTYWAFTDEGKEMTKWFNQIYRDGLLDPDAFTNKFDDWKAKFSTEKIAGSIGGWWICYNAGHEVWQTLDPNTPENKRYIQVGFKSPNVKQAYITGKNKYGSYSTIITDKAKDVENIMKFINFQATERGMALFNWGIPNGIPTYKDQSKTIKEWDIDKDGKWKFDEEAKKLFVTEKWDYNAELALGTGQYDLYKTDDRWADGEHCVWPNQCWYSENKWKTIMMNNMKGTIYDATPMILRQKDEQTTITEQAVKDAWTQYWPITVQSKNDTEFEANWKSFQNALNGANIKAYTKTMEDNYKKNMKKLGK